MRAGQGTNMMTLDRWYFAFGSNMDVDQMVERTGPIREVRRACLIGYRIAFNKLGDDKTGKANICPDEFRKVWGVVYLCDPAALEHMDRNEGVRGGHYYREDVQVQLDSGDVLEAVTYIAGRAFIREALTPSESYLQRILKGARFHRLLEKYIEEIQRVAQGAT